MSILILILYILGSSLVSFAGAAALCKTPTEWWIAACAAVGNAIITGLARLSNPNGGTTPPPGVPAALKIGAALVALMLLTSCAREGGKAVIQPVVLLE
jgi:hypothetical protein